jgi:hypothetical protein
LCTFNFETTKLFSAQFGTVNICHTEERTGGRVLDIRVALGENRDLGRVKGQEDGETPKTISLIIFIIFC